MSLEGSLETVALPEVLQLLSDTSKTGELLVRGDRGEGRLWFARGRLTGFSVGRAEQAADALFDLLRTGEGRFSFEADAGRPDDAHQVGAEEGDEVRPVLEVAQARFAEWTDIVSVVPSMEHLLRLVEDEPADGVKLEPGHWSLVVAIGEGRSVQEVLDRASLAEFDGCRSLKGLVELGLAKVSQPPKRARSRKSTPAASKAAVETLDEPVVDEPVTDEPVALEEVVPEVAYEPVALEEVVPEVAYEPVASDEDRLEMQLDEAIEAHAVKTSVEEVESSEHATEAPLDPGEYVFSSSLDEVSDEPPEEVAPWSVPLVEAAAGAEDEEYVPRPVPLPEPHHDEYANGNDTQDARAALEALIAEIPADGHEASTQGAAPDGLADRGPWTSRELNQMSEWGYEEQQDEATASGSFYDAEAHVPAATPTRFHSYQDPTASAEGTEEYAAADADSVDDQAEEEEEAESKPEPVNRGLLLKILSSVRS